MLCLLLSTTTDKTTTHVSKCKPPLSNIRDIRVATIRLATYRACLAEFQRTFAKMIAF